MQNKELILKLFEIGAVKFGEFKLKSGIMSPIYIDLRLTVSYPEILKLVADAMWEQVKDKNFDVICGVPYTALPIATAISLKQNVPMIMKRKEAKDHGTKQIIEGKFEAGQNCLIVEDLVTSGLSVFETIDPIQNEGLKITDVIVLVNREQGGKKHIEDKGYNLHAVLTISQVLEVLKDENKLNEEIIQKVKDFIKNNQV